MTLHREKIPSGRRKSTLLQNYLQPDKHGPRGIDEMTIDPESKDDDSSCVMSSLENAFNMCEELEAVLVNLVHRLEAVLIGNNAEKGTCSGVTKAAANSCHLSLKIDGLSNRLANLKEVVHVTISRLGV